MKFIALTVKDAYQTIVKVAINAATVAALQANRDGTTKVYLQGVLGAFVVIETPEKIMEIIADCN
jgi:hypothetical protein